MGIIASEIRGVEQVQKRRTRRIPFPDGNLIFLRSGNGHPGIRRIKRRIVHVRILARRQRPRRILFTDFKRHRLRKGVERRTIDAEGAHAPIVISIEPAAPLDGELQAVVEYMLLPVNRLGRSPRTLLHGELIAHGIGDGRPDKAQLQRFCPHGRPCRWRRPSHRFFLHRQCIPLPRRCAGHRSCFLPCRFTRKRNRAL